MKSLGRKMKMRGRAERERESQSIREKRIRILFTIPTFAYMVPFISNYKGGYTLVITASSDPYPY